MPARSLFEYAAVRVVPHVEREEFVNVGVILFCEGLDFLGAEFALDEPRLVTLAGDADLPLVRRHLDAIRLVCEGGPSAGPIGQLPRRERWRWLVAPRSTILQTSSPHAGLCESPDAALRQLVASLVVRRPASGLTSGGTSRVDGSLRGLRVALLESRMESELASLVRRHGGEPLSVPALREVERECAGEVVRACAAMESSRGIAVFTTGVGVERLLRVAASLGTGTALRRALEQGTVVCRGPKPIAVLKRLSVPVHVRAQPPHTTKELLAAVDTVAVSGRDVVLVHDGGGNRDASEHLAGRGARVIDVQPYAWALPEDIAALRSLVETIVRAQVDAVAFTTQVQARHLFAVAEAMGARDALTRSLSERVLVAAVGPTCARALTELGAPPHVVPDQPKMGAMVVALANRFAH